MSIQIVLGFLILLLASCSSESNQPHSQTQRSATEPVLNPGERKFFLPSDASADFTILEVSSGWPERSIVTRRIGKSGTSYSRRLYNCESQTVKYLGSGGSLAEMESSPPDPRMGPIVFESIAYYVGQQACKR